MSEVRRVQVKREGKRDLKGFSAKQSLSEQAYQQIRDEILRGDLMLGAVLSRRRLAERFKMSLLPISEALQRLEVDGIVESQPRIGTRVRIPTPEDIVDNFAVREALETQAARMCCEKMSVAERRQLQKSARELDLLYEASSSESGRSPFLFSVHTLHAQFHLQIAKLAQSPKLLRSIEREQVLIFNWLYDTAAQRNPLPANFHRRLAKSICGADPAAADAAMREHVRYGLEGVLKNLNGLGIEGAWRHKRGKLKNRHTLQR